MGRLKISVYTRPPSPGKNSTSLICIYSCMSLPRNRLTDHLPEENQAMFLASAAIYLGMSHGQSCIWSSGLSPTESGFREAFPDTFACNESQYFSFAKFQQNPYGRSSLCTMVNSDDESKELRCVRITFQRQIHLCGRDEWLYSQSWKRRESRGEVYTLFDTAVASGTTGCQERNKQTN